MKTYELFQRGETVGIFQYESPGMQKYMKELKPTVFGDLIAMNALYRPGPMEYIPSFIKRKNGEEEIKYDLDACEEYLERNLRNYSLPGAGNAFVAKIGRIFQKVMPMFCVKRWVKSRRMFWIK